jgi:glycosyltransferase involved in cell wall biosynthesis
MRKIAFVAEYIAPPGKPRTGGLDALTYNLAKCLTGLYEVHIFTSYLDQTERIEYRDNLIVHRVGLKRTEIQRGDFLRRAIFNRSVESELILLKPDLINAIGFVSFNGAYHAAKKLDVPVIATVLEIWQGEWISNVGLVTGLVGEILERIYLKKNYTRYIAISKFTQEKLIKQLKIPREKISVVYCGVSLNEIHSIKTGGKYPRPTIITICRLVEYKRVQDIIQAIALVKSSFADINLKIVGIGPYKSELEQLVKKENLIENVEFCGRISGTDELVSVLKQSHIFVLGSTVEGFGMVIIEAMASGIPFIAADIPAIREITNGGQGGFLVPPASPDKIAEKMKMLLMNPEQYIEKTREGAGIVKQYDWNNIAKSLNEVVKELIKE